MNLNALITPVMKTVSADEVQKHINAIWERNKLSNSTEYKQCAEYVYQQLDSLGIEIEKIELPADGETTYGDAVMPLGWNCFEASVEILKPIQRTLTFRSNEPNSIGMWSPNLPEEGIEADLVCLKKGEASEVTILDVEGKVIYTPKRADVIRMAASKGGAVGIISSWVPNPSADTATQWINRNADNPGGLGTTKREKPLSLFAITPRDARDLLSFAKEETVTLRLKSRCTLEADTIPMVSARIPGDPGLDDVLLFAPLYGQGANFNASGAAALIEAARTINTLIEEEQIPRMQRGVRFLLYPKHYGALAFAHLKKEETQRIIYALNVETGAGNPDVSWSRWTYRTSPVCQRHFTDGLGVHLFKQFLEHWRPQRFFEQAPFSLTADTILNDPKIGIPTHWLMGGTDNEVRLTSEDKPETVDKRSCIDLAAVTASMVYTVGAVGIADIPYLAFWNFELAQDHIRSDMQTYLDRVAETRNGTDLNELLGEATRHFALRAEVESKALQTLEQLGEEMWQEPEWECVKEFQSAINDLCNSSVTIIRSHLQIRTEQLGIPITKLDVAADPIEDERIPKRTDKALGTITLDDLPYDEWTTPVKQSPRSNVPFILSWWLADGERNIGEIQRILHLEVTRYRECIPAWFTFLEKHGYITQAMLTPSSQS